MRSDVGSTALTAREISEIQRTSDLPVSRVVEANGRQYAVPQAPHVRLAQIGRDTPFAHYQAWIYLKPASEAVAKGDINERLAATVTFTDETRGLLASPDDSWAQSEVEIPGIGMTKLWFETEACIDDRMPPPVEDQPAFVIRVVWTIAETPMEIFCMASLAPTPSGVRPLSCFGGSAVTSSTPAINLYGGALLDNGCKSALVSLVSSFAHLPLIVADWRQEFDDAAS